MEHVIKLEDKFYILADSPLTDDRTLEVKHGEIFAVFDRQGDIFALGRNEQGLYYEGTRFLSRLQLAINGHKPLLLSSTVKEDNALIAVDLTNPDLNGGIAGEQDVAGLLHGTLHIFRGKVLWQESCLEHIRITHYGLSPCQLTLAVELEADFADIFEVRGTMRRRRGQRLEPVVGDRVLVLAYCGLDGVMRQTRIEIDPPPARIAPDRIELELALQPRRPVSLHLSIACEVGEALPCQVSYDSALALSGKALTDAHEHDGRVCASNELFHNWLARSMSDLRMMVTATAHGPYPYAGIPWFSTAFGRDGLITALAMLWLDPGMARGVLSYLAATQAKEVMAEQDAEPGKILHETRKGEMAALGEIPFGRYYGTVDATPLFLVLAGTYYERTADRAFIERLWPNIQAALDWIDSFGDSDGDGFVDYARHSTHGLVQQGWKDSQDSVFHADGMLVRGPVALCEVQGYVYLAKQAAAGLAAMLGYAECAAALQHQAEALRQSFEERFWCEELATYALALDGAGQPCKVRASNAGHCLCTGIAAPERARRVSETLMSEALFSGWGIRTLAANEVRYNPMSYHNGSIWPHDNALIASGMARYGLKDMALRVMTGLFEASQFMDLHRLPELFCGFQRRPGESPTRYPVACAPQSWAAASCYMMLQACLGVQIKAAEQTVYFNNPTLPEYLGDIRIHNLRVGPAAVDLQLRRHRHDQDVTVSVLSREGDVQIVKVG
jgi:glycogen debranching enzyme